MSLFENEKPEDIEATVDKLTSTKQEEKQETKEEEPLTYDKPIDKPVGKASYKKYKLRLKKGKGFDANRAVLFGSVLGMLAIIMFYQMVDQVSAGLGIILLFLGMSAFFPLGAIVGKFLLDPYTRCKIMRKMKGKNYALVHFVHKGGQRVDIKIKNLDDDVIIKKEDTKLWVLEEGGIYYITRDDSKILHSEIKGDNAVTSPQDVPMIFLDPETMLPLRFYKPKTASNPQHVGGTILGYINNQIAKNMFFQKQKQTIFNLIILVICFCNLAGLMMLYDALVGF